ncbi:MAG TPA: 3,4-dihydroxy-2-butanone-4-phosphate synthase [Candidatus Nanoarchaeia archaeon]|nr:3,4-dihydroxy-2-butanone-4-phosphate synthase [Candidatus Nanoarchaeia archaeon]
MKSSNLKEAVNDFKKGKFVILVDDKQRENEGDLVLAAEKVSPEKINFMIKHARGLVCVPMLKKRLEVLNIPPMTQVNTELHKCKFTVSVDYKYGTSTGISAFDRARTIKSLIDDKTKPDDLAKPGHVFPLIYDEGGLKKRMGHTEAAIELCKLAGMYPAAVICEIIADNGKMAEMPDLHRMAMKFNLKILRINALI